MSNILQLGREQFPNPQSSGLLLLQQAAPGVNGTRRWPPRPIPGQQLPPALLSPAHMQQHTAPRAITRPQSAREGPSSPAKCYWQTHHRQWCIGAASAPAGRAGGDMRSPRQRQGAGPAGRGVAAARRPCWWGLEERPRALPSIRWASALSTAPICRNLWYRCGAD